MDEDDCDFLLLSMRESSALAVSIRAARSKAEAAEILEAYGVPEEDFDKGFPYLAKVVRDLPDERPPAP
jgi:hypothetical protein